MSTVDWIVVGAYVGAMILMSVWLGRGQEDQEDHYAAQEKQADWATESKQCQGGDLGVGSGVNGATEHGLCASRSVARLARGMWVCAVLWEGWRHA